MIVLITLAVIVVIGIIGVSFITGSYNTLVSSDLNVENQWGKVQSAYERRLDLLPNLAATVKGSADFEQETLVEVAKARGGLRVANNPAQLEEANRPVMSMMAGMMTYTEQYPEIKSTEAFKGLMDEIAGTENRIKWERDAYNDQVRDYKLQVKRYPTNLIAGMFGFEESKWDSFTALENASVAPTIDFSD